MNILILGAGVQGTLYGLRLARAGHSVTLIARGNRAEELRQKGAFVRNAINGHSDVMHLPLLERVAPNTDADLCFVFVRREQIEGTLSDLTAACAVKRVVFMVNHANGSDSLFAALGRDRVVLGFPSVAGGIESGVDVYVDVAEQATVVERQSPDVAALVRSAGFRVNLVADMDSWLKRHAVFVTAVSCALYKRDVNALLLASDKKLVRTFVLAVRQGWAALDLRGVSPAPISLRAIFSWVPLPFAIAYWCNLFASTRGEYYFARHTRHATAEIAALAGDVDSLLQSGEAPQLRFLYEAIGSNTNSSLPAS